MKNYFFYLLCLLIFVTCETRAASFQPFINALLWQASESNSSWATIITFPNSKTQNVRQNTIHFHPDLGFKAGFAYSPDQFWDTKFYWTYFSTSRGNSIPFSNQIVTSLFFSGSYFISRDIFFGANMDWQITMNMFDLELSHTFMPLCGLTLIPKIGIKGGSIRQNINITWKSLFFNSTENMKNNFNGIGPSFGINSKIYLYKDFRFIADVSTALMYGIWHVNDTYKRPPALFGLIKPTTITTQLNQSKLGTFMLDYFLGIEWLHEGRSKIAVQLGYEMQYWANQLRMAAVQQLPTLGDLTLQGATCGISIDL